MSRLAAAFAATLLAVSVVSGHPLDQPMHRHLQEDDPGWNCHIDGNRICGPGHDRVVLMSYDDSGFFTECDWEAADDSPDC